MNESPTVLDDRLSVRMPYEKLNKKTTNKLWHSCFLKLFTLSILLCVLYVTTFIANIEMSPAARNYEYPVLNIGTLEWYQADRKAN